MNRVEALDKATELVTALSAAPTNSRGYAEHGHKAPTLQERTSAILEVAEFLLGPGSDLRPPLAPTEEG